MISACSSLSLYICICTFTCYISLITVLVCKVHARLSLNKRYTSGAPRSIPTWSPWTWNYRSLWDCHRSTIPESIFRWMVPSVGWPTSRPLETTICLPDESSSDWHCMSTQCSLDPVNLLSLCLGYCNPFCSGIVTDAIKAQCSNSWHWRRSQGNLRLCIWSSSHSGQSNKATNRLFLHTRGTESAMN